MGFLHKTSRFLEPWPFEYANLDLGARLVFSCSGAGFRAGSVWT